MPNRRWRMPYGRRRPSLSLGHLCACTPCCLGSPNSLASHGTSISLSHSMDSFCSSCLGLVSPSRRIVSGPPSALSCSGFIQLTSCLSQYSVQSYNLLFSRSELITLFSVVSTVDTLVRRLARYSRTLAVSASGILRNVARPSHIPRINCRIWVFSRRTLRSCRRTPRRQITSHDLRLNFTNRRLSMKAPNC